MEGLDTLLLRAIFQSIQDEIDSEKIKNINLRLKQEYGLTFQEVFNKFDEMHTVLQKFESDKLEPNHIFKTAKHYDNQWMHLRPT